MNRPSGFRMFDVVAMIFVATLLISNTIAVKVIVIAGFVLPAGILCFPLAYIFGDVLTEVYGYTRPRRVIWCGFACLAMMSAFYYLATIMPAAVFWKDQESFSKLFGFVPRIAAASFVAFLVGSFLNAAVMSRMKVMTGGRFLWLRTIGSTIVGEGADSFIFNFAAFLGVFPLHEVVFIALSGFVLKTAYEILATPITYVIVARLKKVEGVDQFDREISYNPFRMT